MVRTESFKTDHYFTQNMKWNMGTRNKPSEEAVGTGTAAMFKIYLDMFRDRKGLTRYAGKLD